MRSVQIMIDTEIIPSHYVELMKAKESPFKLCAGCLILLSTSQIAKIHGVATQTVVRWILAGVEVRGVKYRLNAYRAGRSYRVSQEEMAEFIESLSKVLKPEIKVSDAADRAAGERAVARLEKKLAPRAKRKP